MEKRLETSGGSEEASSALPYVRGATVRSRMPSVALSANSGTIGHVPSGFHLSSTADQS
jgi:hypothetical protein